MNAIEMNDVPDLAWVDWPTHEGWWWARTAKMTPTVIYSQLFENQMVLSASGDDGMIRRGAAVPASRFYPVIAPPLEVL